MPNINHKVVQSSSPVRATAGKFYVVYDVVGSRGFKRRDFVRTDFGDVAYFDTQDEAAKHIPAAS